MTFEQYKTIINAFLDFYPDDRIDLRISHPDLQVALDKDAANETIDENLRQNISSIGYVAMTITVYYPEIVVATEDGRQSHTIYDVYVQHIFPAVEMKLGRSTYTYNEVNVGYRHSHVQIECFTHMSYFCTGSSSTPYNVIKEQIRSGDYHDFSLLIQSYIITVERMIKVESASGGPYIYMDRIGKSGNSRPLSVTPVKDHAWQALAPVIRNKIADFIEYYCSFGLDSFYYDGKCWQLDCSDTEFITKATRVAKTFKNFHNISLWEYYAFFFAGLYYNMSRPLYTVKEGSPVEWSFKGTNPRIKIISEPDFKAETVVILSSTVLNMLYSFLINFINSYYANAEIHKDSLRSRACKIKAALISEIRVQN